MGRQAADRRPLVVRDTENGDDVSGRDTPDSGRLFPTGRRRMVIEYAEGDDVEVVLQTLLRERAQEARDEGDLDPARLVTIQKEYRHWGAP